MNPRRASSGPTFRPSLYITCVARVCGSLRPKSPWSVKAILIVLRLSLPRIAPCFVADEVLARDRSEPLRPSSFFGTRTWSFTVAEDFANVRR